MILGVDVSSYNGKIDWKKVKKAGYDFAILKIIRKDLKADTRFEENWKNAESAGVEVTGVYNYSYATGIEKAKKDAQAVIRQLNGRKCVVWLDVEDKCQMKLGYGLVSIIKVYQAEIRSAGLAFGVYTGQSFYNSYLKKYKGEFDCPLWIARYGKNDGTRNTKYQPQIDDMIGWQYTSKGKVNGISGNVDLNIFYQQIEPSVIKSSNPYPKPTRVLSAKKFLGRWTCRGNDVKYVQYELIDRGFLVGKIDGVYGSQTADGVKRLQKSVGVTVDGIVGVQTRRYL